MSLPCQVLVKPYRETNPIHLPSKPTTVFLTLTQPECLCCARLSPQFSAFRISMQNNLLEILSISKPSISALEE